MRRVCSLASVVFLYKQPIDEILFASFRSDMYLTDQLGAIKEVGGAVGCGRLAEKHVCAFLLFSEKREKLLVRRFPS